MRRLLEAARRLPGPAPLRTLFVGGDAVPADLLAQMRQAFPRAELRVLYGPTEATLLATSWHVPPGEEPAGSRLGRPLPGVEIRLCDPAGRDVPAGSAGEIWIGGAGVTLGYAGNPELTAERFPEADGRRWYRTGDLARRRADGGLEFLGRTDLQVKVRGVRIEPGEIEAALAALPEVAEAAVVPRDDLPGGRGLAAWIVAAPGQAPDPSRLRETLRGRLPEAYLPAVLAAVESLPLTPHGKVDRKALERRPLPQAAAEPEAAGRPAAALTPTEELLAGLWSGLLARDPERIRPSDDFFAQGGHSLLAMQLVSRIRERFGADLPLREIFEAPTLGALARRVEAATRSSAGVPETPLVPAPRGPGMPLSFGQERLWFLDRLAPGESIYNISMALRLGGRVSQAALEAALAGLARRHEALRTTFGSRDGQPFQRIAEPGRPALPRIDLTALPAGPRETEALRLAAEDAARPFDLERGPLWRAALVALEDGRQALLLTLHHIVSDGWSMDILFRETTELYAAALQEREPSLVPLPVQYADYAVWQRDWLRGAVLQGQLAAWRERLAGAPEILDLPLDRPRGNWIDPRGASERMALAAAEAHAVRTLAHERGTTLFMVLLAAFAAVIGRWTGGEDVPVGTPVANRNRPEIEGLIGFFVNTLVLRADLAGDPAFGDLLERARQTSLHAYAHQDLPFERLVEELQPERSLGATPLFQVMLSLENQPMSRVQRPGLTVERLPREERAATFDLVLGVAESGETLIGGFSYRAALFDATTIRRLRGTFQTFLAAAARNPERRLSDLPLLADAERHQLLAEWSGGAACAAEPVPVHVRIARQAARTPEAPAVLAAEESLTFGELDRRAAGLAARLRELGLGPESRVGLAVGRSAGLLAGMLGIWKAGAAWVPLDPAQPAERLAFLLQDAGVAAIVAEHAVEIGEGRERVLLDTLDREASVPETPENTEPGLAAYVLYTSGSTGTPKGVVIEHRSLSRYLAWVEEALGGETLPATSSAAFDASLKQLLAPLAAGRPVHLLGEAEAEPEPLLRRLAADGLGAWNGVPSLWSFVLDLIEEGGARPERLRRLLLGGEALPADLLERTRRVLPGVEVWNLYGPTEATANATAARLEPGEGIHLGKPVAGARAYVLGLGGDPAPLGAFGELALAGGGLARGYLNRPALTAERFLPDPFSGEPGARLYRTGDRVRRRADGRLEHHGRTDRQIKLRGIRVELGEIEAALREHPAVKEAAVAALPTERGDLRLAAFVVAPGASADLAKDLRTRLRGRLAAPLVPSDIAPVAALPRTPTGKLDRQALARLQPHAEERPYEAPRDSVEQLLAEIWQDLLGVERVGLRDNFFLLGGHSLLATRLAVRIRRELGVELPLRVFFDTADLEALAQEVLALQLSHQSKDDLASLLAELEGLSEEDALTLLGEGGGDE
jgi:amino acid adenylation domain-containing protein